MRRVKMGSASVFSVNSGLHLVAFQENNSDMEKGDSKSTTPAMDPDTEATTEQKKKRKMSETLEKVSSSRKMPKRAAACSDFTDKPFRLSKKASVVDSKRDVTVDDEITALGLTKPSGDDADDSQPNRRLTDFIFYNASDGKPCSVEMLEVSDVFISGRVLPLEESAGSKKEKGIICKHFGRLESWAISGYEEGSPVIWVSTEHADYNCQKPSSSYRKLYNLFFDKARACIEVYGKLSKSSGGNPNLTLDELLSAVVRSMGGTKKLLSGMLIKDFIISQGAFIYQQLIGLDETSEKGDHIFSSSPVLAALGKEDSNQQRSMSPKGVMNTSLKIGDQLKINQSTSSTCEAEKSEDAKMAKLLQETEDLQTKIHKRSRRPDASSSNNFYIKINEDEIANDYPLPAYYVTSHQETDEYLIFDSDGSMPSPDHRSMLHNWSFYNSDTRFVSLELLPMKPCAEIDVTIYGSGSMTTDDGSGFCVSSSSAGAEDADGIPIYLSAIKEWMIEFGGEPLIYISIRTDLTWYLLGKPSSKYAPWYEPVLKTARLGINIYKLLKEQSRAARLSFEDVIKKISELDKNHLAYISSDPVEVDRYVVVHAQILLQQFAEYPDNIIRNCAFVTRLRSKLEERRHTKLLVNKKTVPVKKEVNLNPRAAIAPVVSKRKAMQATTTRLINRIWGEFYSNYSPEDSREEDGEVKGDEQIEEEQEDKEEEDIEEVEEEKALALQQIVNPNTALKPENSRCNDREIGWDGEPVGKTCEGQALYKRAFVHAASVTIGCSVLVETDDSKGVPPIYFVEYMFETSDARKMVHGREMERGIFTVLGSAANEREVFLTNKCVDFNLGDIKQTVVVQTQLLPWGHQYRKENADLDKLDRARAEERKKRGLPTEFYCRSLYWPERGAFFCLPSDTMGLGNGVCNSCKLKETQMEKETFKVNTSMTSFIFKGSEYCVCDFVYLGPHHFASTEMDKGTFKSGRNIGLKAYIVCHLLEIEVPEATVQPDPESTRVKLRRFFRPEDISAEKAYHSDIREVYYSEEVFVVPASALEGKCDVRKKQDLPSLDGPALYEHIFFCERLYDSIQGTVKQLPAHIKFCSSKARVIDDAAYLKKKGKRKVGEIDSDDVDKQNNVSHRSRLATLDIFAGCGGLSEGLQLSGVSSTKWAIEYEEPAGDAFKLNHPDSLMFVDNCNVILRAIMSACGDAEECISTSEAAELAAKLDEKIISNLPRPGQVDFINGGPPCQGFSGMNRFNQGTWSKVQCEMILAFLSFADYFRPKFFLLENVRNFIAFNKRQTFRLTLASLLEMGYQVRFGILEAGAYGVSQSRKRAFIWAASPKEALPEWPEPMHVFSGPELKVTLSGNTQYVAVRNTASGAPFRAITVKDTIGDLPIVGNGASAVTMEYNIKPVSWFQQSIRGGVHVLSDHISKEMNELNLIRCKKIPKRPGADWRDLPDEKIRLSSGQVVDLIPWCLPNTAQRHNHWKGLFGRLDWEGNFPTSITDPQPMGKVGMCFHPVQDRILTVRECARSQGFMDSYKFAGTIHHKHRQIGNAVPPPLAFALGRKLKEAVESKQQSAVESKQESALESKQQSI